MRRPDHPPVFPLWLYAVVFVIGGAGLLWGCASTPPVEQPPQVTIFRQFLIVPVPAPEEQCCWYVPPGDEDYGPI